jgi:hypothetical protein
MMQSLLVIHPFQLPAGWKFSGPHITCITWNNILYSKAEYTNTQQDLPIYRKDFTSDHARLLASGFVCQKLLSSESLLSHFSSCSSRSNHY